MTPTAIHTRDLAEGNLLAQLKLVYAANPQAFKVAFMKGGLLVKNPSELALLAELHHTGKDRKGFKNAKGQTIALDVRKTMESIVLTEQEIKHALSTTNS